MMIFKLISTLNHCRPTAMAHRPMHGDQVNDASLVPLFNVRPQSFGCLGLSFCHYLHLIKEACSMS